MSLITLEIKMCSRIKSALKAISWRLVGALDTFALSFFVTGRFGAAAGLVGLEVLTKSLWYYGHERLWETSMVGRLIERVTQ